MNSKTAEFNAKIQAARQSIFKHQGLLWRHYKGGVYMVSLVAIDTTTLEPVVIYYRKDGPDFDPVAEVNIFFSRPLSEWFDDIEVEGLGATMVVKRFVPVTPKQVTQYVEVECQNTL